MLRPYTCFLSRKDLNMLDLKFIRENPDLVRDAIHKKNITLDLNDLLELDAKLTASKKETEDKQAEANRVAKDIPKAAPETRGELVARGKALKAELATLEPAQRELEAQLRSFLLRTPQIPWSESPVGPDDSANVETRRVGTPRDFDFRPLNHVALIEKNGWGELERIAKVSGSRSYALKGDLALYEQALLHFATRVMLEDDFTFMTLPSYAREDVFVGHGQFPSARDQVFELEADKFLSGTAEVLLNSLHAGEILELGELPKTYAAISPCFRAEAGAAGKDTRGLIRVHQFNKVEQYVLMPADADSSAEMFERLMANSERILNALELPYRILEVSTGDMGAGKFRQIDIETWVPSEGKYRETHSCSALHDWQARRTGLRYRDADGKVRFGFTLNNTALATPRILVMLLENHQNADGTVNIPSALQGFMGKTRLEPTR
jgi:seryl-tRNA synthetase